jgi:hypothetical protein
MQHLTKEKSTNYQLTGESSMLSPLKIKIENILAKNEMWFGLWFSVFNATFNNI